jgi:hypothetical protein
MRTILAAASVAACLIFGVAAADASSVTISFTGTIFLASDPAGLTTYGTDDLHNAISGTLTIDPIGNTPHPNGATKTEFTGASTLTSDPFSHAGTTVIQTLSQTTKQNSHFGIQFFAPTEHDVDTDSDFIPSELLLDFDANNGGNSVLHSLADLPTDLDGIIAYLGGGLSQARGILSGGPNASSLAIFTFNIKTLTITPTIVPTPTPIPATLPLFGVGLGALAFTGWRRRFRRAA